MIKNDNVIFCTRRYHTWNKRQPKIPKFCPKCKTPYWNKPRKRVGKRIIVKMIETIIEIHNNIIKLSGGEIGVREDGGIYNSTVKLLNHQSKNRKNPVSIGAFAINEFAKRHYFNDGNKRTAYAVAKVFMLVNRFHLKISYKEATDFMIKVADYNSKLDFNNIGKWIEENCHPITEKELESYLSKNFVNLMLGDEEDE